VEGSPRQRFLHLKYKMARRLATQIMNRTAASQKASFSICKKKRDLERSPTLHKLKSGAVYDKYHGKNLRLRMSDHIIRCEQSFKDVRYVILGCAYRQKLVSWAIKCASLSRAWAAAVETRQLGVVGIGAARRHAVVH